MSNPEPAAAEIEAVLSDRQVEAVQLAAGWDNWPVTYGLTRALAKAMVRGLGVLHVDDLKAIRAAATILSAHAHRQVQAEADAEALLAQFFGEKRNG